MSITKNFQPKSVLFTIGSLQVGGAERQMVLLIEGLRSAGYHCEVAVLSADGPLRARLLDQDVVIHDLGYRTQSSKIIRLAQILRGFVRFWLIARRTKPDILQAYLPLTNFLGALAGKFAGVKTIITCRRGLGTHQDRHPLWAPIDRLSNRLSTIITVNSRAVLEDTVRRDRISPDDLVLIYNGLEFPEPDELGGDARNLRDGLLPEPEMVGFLSVGNLIPYKGYIDLIDAIARLKDIHGRFRFFIAGRDDGQKTQLLAHMAKHGISGETIRFLGSRDDVPVLMSALDCFIMPSHEEGFSNALLEALASGMPVIATEVGGNPEALEGGRFGTLIPPHNPDRLAGAISQMVANIDGAKKASGETASHTRKKYSVPHMVEAYQRLYEENS